MTGVPYASASSDDTARKEVRKILLRLGCKDIGFQDLDTEHALLLQFKHHGRPTQLKVSAKGWAALYRREKPWTPRHRRSQVEYEQAALRQGLAAVNSILRDWIKGQVTAVECGVLSFEAVFLPFMLTSDGRTVSERVEELGLLPSPESAKVVSLPAPNTTPR
jgi:hypothetical protein